MTETNNSKTVFICGASRGIGKAISIEYAKHGWNLFLTARSEENLELVKNEILSKYSVHCEICKLDVSLETDYQNAIEVFKSKFSGLDLVILNSGISIPTSLSELDIPIFRTIFETNFFGILYGIKHFTAYFKTQISGKIAIVSSLADARGFPGSSAYSASKTAISHVAEAARTELKRFNIDVISVKPGFVKTDMTSNHKFYLPFLISAEKYARNFYHGIEKGKKRIYYPYPTAFLTYLLKIIPSFLFDYFAKFWKGENGDL